MKQIVTKIVRVSFRNFLAESNFKIYFPALHHAVCSGPLPEHVLRRDVRQHQNFWRSAEIRHRLLGCELDSRRVRDELRFGRLEIPADLLRHPNDLEAVDHRAGHRLNPSRNYLRI